MAHNPSPTDGLNPELPSIADGHSNPFEPTFQGIGAPLRLPDGSALDDPLRFGDSLGQTIDDLTGTSGLNTDSRFPDSRLSSLRPPEPVYGDEFQSGILPIDIAAHQMGKAIDQIESASAVAIAATMNEVSAVTQAFIRETQQVWEAPENEFRQNLSHGLNQSVVRVRHLFEQFSHHPKVKQTMARLGEQAETKFYDLQNRLEQLQDKTETWVDRLHGQAGFVSTATQSSDDNRSSRANTNITIESPDLSPDLSNAVYTTDNIYAQSGFAPASVSPNSILGIAKGNCTWYANGRAEELGADPRLLDRLNGNAFEWDDDAQEAGITISDHPQTGMVSIAQWENGHVAIVEHINHDGSIHISESSYDPGGQHDYLYGTRTIAIDDPDRFILIPKTDSHTNTENNPLPDTNSETVVASGYGSATATESATITGTAAEAITTIGDQSYQWTAYTVQPGDTLSQIALRTTGSAANYPLIAHHNSIADPDYIRTGQVIEIPQASADESSPVPPETIAAPTGYEAYVVVAGDTLWDIAERQLGDPLHWIAIFDPDKTNFTEEEARRLQAGSVVYLPKNLMGNSPPANEDGIVVTPIPGEALPPTSSDPAAPPPPTSQPNPTPQPNPTEQPGNPTNTPALPIQTNLGYTVESERVAEGHNINAGSVRGVIVDDRMAGKISIESGGTPDGEGSAEGSAEDGSSLTPGGLTQNIELANFAKDVGHYWEAEIIKGLVKWDAEKGFSFNLGGKEVSVWVSDLNAEAFNFKTGTPTTRASFKVEGNLDEMVNSALQAQGAAKRLNLPKLKAEIEYTAEVAWQAERPLLPRPVPVPVSVPVEAPVPVQSEPDRLPGRPAPPSSPPPFPLPTPSPVTRPFPAPAPSPSPEPWYSRIDAADVGAAAAVVGGAIVVGAAIATAPAWVPAAGATAAVAGLATLVGSSIFGSDDDEPMA